MKRQTETDTVPLFRYEEADLADSTGDGGGQTFLMLSERDRERERRFPFRRKVGGRVQWVNGTWGDWCTLPIPSSVVSIYGFVVM